MYEKVWNKWFLKIHVINTINITTPISIQWRLTFTFYEHIQSQPNSSTYYDTFQKSVPNISNWKLCGRQIIRINEIKVLWVHTSYIGIYINNVRVKREKWLLETTRKGWYQSIYMSVLVKFINPFALSGFFFLNS